MNLKNYTSEAEVQKTIGRITALLVEVGAKAIGMNYEDGKITAITFQLQLNGSDHLIRLPADPNGVYEALKKQVKQPQRGTFERLREQADRTAWKLQQDWLEVELSLIQLRQKEPLQAFLPYVWDGQQTFYERLKGSGFKQLPEKSSA